ncbi:hypothetical protein ACVIHI_005335 [Bradyrhizobium sp. USDA 4524]|nr:MULTISPECIES: hypothetical protein [unclassified Bradyrhizobium]MCP1841743.1 hypothetical protein [Bradyrhizobium sp. USDA 4538]MCP1902307.1 hypothetical protein [Bradyrhizobium sp. USDA 4537]MCP1992035.1 hypothetical protein [Bradyrhizobium sp. USDA 4539]
MRRAGQGMLDIGRQRRSAGSEPSRAENDRSPSDARRSQGDAEEFAIARIANRNEIAVANHLRLFGPDPVSDEAAVILGVLVVGTVVTDDVVCGDVAREMEEVSGHLGQLVQIAERLRGRRVLGLLDLLRAFLGKPAIVDDLGDELLDPSADPVCNACHGLPLFVLPPAASHD